MASGNKRAAEDEPEAETSGRTTRGSKAKKTERAPSPAKRKGAKKGGAKTNLSAASFKARALPLHINITHTPPVLADDGAVTLASTDPGFVGTAALVPAAFSTGSYGWKGSKRFTVEVDGPEGGEKEKVHVMLTINATVVGSKDAPADEADGEAKEEKEDKEDKMETEERNEEKAEEKAEAQAEEEAA